MSNRFPADDEHLHPYPGNLKHHKVDKKEQRKLLCEMMKDDAKSGLYNEKKREPLLSDEDVQRIALGYFTPEYVQKSRVAQDLYNASYVAIHKALEICEAARAKDAELIQMLVEALHWYVEEDDVREGDFSAEGGVNWDEENAPWIEGRNEAILILDAAAAAGFKPTEP